MQLYWQNTASDGLWDTVGNWWENAGATTPHGALPASGDSVTYATGETSTITISAVTVDLGLGVCDLANAGTLIVGSSGSIVSGTWQNMNAALVNNGTIDSTSMQGATTFHCQFTNFGSIIGSIVSDAAGCKNAGTIAQGHYSGANFANAFFDTQPESGTINGGTWTGLGFVNTATNPSNDTTFGGSINGGTYAPVASVVYSAIIIGGKMVLNPQPTIYTTAANPGFPTYSPNVTATGTPSGGSLRTRPAV